MRRGAGVADRVRGRDEGETWNQDLIAGFDSGHTQCDLKRSRPVDYRDRERRSRVVTQPALEPLHIRTSRRHPTGIDAFLHILPLISLERRLVKGDRPSGTDDAFHRGNNLIDH